MRAPLTTALLFAATLSVAGPVRSDILVASRTLRANTIVQPGDVELAEGEVEGLLNDETQAIGLETRVAIYAGRAIRSGDLGPVTLIQRNQIVTVTYGAGGLSIVTDGRALDRGGAGDLVRVMNISSRSTVTGIVTADGQVLVGGNN